MPFISLKPFPMLQTKAVMRWLFAVGFDSSFVVSPEGKSNTKSNIVAEHRIVNINNIRRIVCFDMCLLNFTQVLILMKQSDFKF